MKVKNVKNEMRVGAEQRERERESESRVAILTDDISEGIHWVSLKNKVIFITGFLNGYLHLLRVNNVHSGFNGFFISAKSQNTCC